LGKNHPTLVGSQKKLAMALNAWSDSGRSRKIQCACGMASKTKADPSTPERSNVVMNRLVWLMHEVPCARDAQRGREALQIERYR